MRKVSLCIVILLAISLFATPVRAEEISVSAKSAVIIEADTGRIIYGKNENEIRPMASTTKIMTTLLCLESGNLDEKFVVDADAIRVEGSSMGLTEGDIVTKRILCCGMLLPSGNDAANATAIKLAGNYDDFALMMNRRAVEIGMVNTNFVTPSGLDDESHASTAYDMALLAREAMKNDDFVKICAEQNVKVEFGNPPYERWLKNTNRLLGMYDGCIGVKTGFTDEAGRCLVSSVERDGVRLICVTLNAPDDWNDHIKMYNYGFEKVKSYSVDKGLEKIDIVGGCSDYVNLKSSGDGTLTLFDGEYEKLKAVVYLPKFVYAPVKENEYIGKIEYCIDGNVVLEEKIFTAECCDEYNTENELSDRTSFFSLFGNNK